MFDITDQNKSTKVFHVQAQFHHIHLQACQCRASDMIGVSQSADHQSAMSVAAQSRSQRADTTWGVSGNAVTVWLAMRPNKCVMVSTSDFSFHVLLARRSFWTLSGLN